MGLDLFKAVVGLRFYHGVGEAFVFDAGQYGNGRGALFLRRESGEVHAKVTVNLDEQEPEADAFFVKWATEDGAARVDEYRGRASSFWTGIYDLGIFEDTLERVDQGFVSAYAAKWRFAQCETAGEGHTTRYAVECPGCRAALDRAYERTKTDRLARDAVRRLRSMEPEETFDRYARAKGRKG